MMEPVRVKIKRETLEDFERAGIAIVNGVPIMKRRCRLCTHFNVCSIYKAIHPLMENWPDSQRPFEAEDIAQICKEFKLREVEK